VSDYFCITPNVRAIFQLDHVENKLNFDMMMIQEPSDVSSSHDL